MSIDSPQRLQDEVTIRFAGDSGDGMQLTGSLFTNATALKGNDLRTLPEFPAEIRAPAGTVPGVSSFQLHFGSKEILTPGDMCDVLVAMNAAALKANLDLLRRGGTVIANTAGFDKRNLGLAHYDKDANPLEDDTLNDYQLIDIDITKLTKECLSDPDLSHKDVERSKNMFVLGLLYWLYNRPMDSTINFLNEKFSEKNPALAEGNIKVLKAGYNFGETAELFTERYDIKQADIEPGTYRNVTGNEATVLGLAAATKRSGLPMFFGSYPITPASDILHGLSQLKNFGIRTFQAEDEIAAVTSSIGAAFGGSLAVTSSSGPGIALKGEAIGLAVMLELPLVVLNIQRAGPSTGMPTKTEQADLMQAMYGRNGESPLAIVAPSSPADCFNMVFEASRIALEHMIPVMYLSDGYLGNGSEPWKFPATEDLAKIKTNFVEPRTEDDDKFLPYKRDERLVRGWALPGTPGLEHRVGGLEKEDLTGDVSYDPENHQKMVDLRREKRDKIADNIPLQDVEIGEEQGETVVVGWGSTFGSIKTAVHELRLEGHDISHIHVRYLSPFPRNLEYLLNNFENVIVPEINDGQLVRLLRDQFMLAAHSITKVQGRPYGVEELKTRILECLRTEATS
ncbi:MAG: 2-oxoacid:acceptor oxidoreductase subunit alpha [Bacteroidota bacterium]